MKKQITFGLIASGLALTTAAFAPTEAQANDRERAMNHLAMQMYMNNMAAQQQLYNPYYGNRYYGNSYYGNPYYNRNVCGNGYYRNGRYWNNNWNNGWGYGNAANTVGRILNRIF